MAANTSVAIPTDRATASPRVARFFVSGDAQEDGSLENIANKVVRTPSEGVDAARSDRWAARGFLWQESKLNRVRGCGRNSILPDGSVQVRSNGAAVGFAGLASCGSIHACPVCNAKINAVRRLELGVMIAAAESQGMQTAFGAKTIRHHAAQPLAALWPKQSDCWRAVTVDTTVRRIRAELGFIGYARAAEVTIGLNGWHPHIHPMYFFEGTVSDRQLEDLHAAEISAWINKAERLGLDAPLSAAQHLHAVTGPDAAEKMGDYFTKAGHQTTDSVAWEMTSTQTKTGRQWAKTVSPWVILAGARAGDADALELWHEYERASKGKRVLTYSRGLRRRFGLDVEATDEEIAETEVGTSDDALFQIEDWSPIRRNPRLGAGVLAAVRAGGMAAGRMFCAENGIPTRDTI